MAVGRCKTIRRTETTTCTPSLSSRLRSPLTCVRAHAVRAARSRSSYINTVVDPARGVEEVEDLRGRKAAVEAHEKPRLGKRDAQHVQEAPEQPARSARHPDVARSQDRGAEVLVGFVVEGQEGQQRQIAPAVIVAIEERELLRAMGRVIGGVQIDRNAARAPAEPLLMPLDHARRELVAHRIELLGAHVIFKPRDRRLRPERVADDGVAPQQQLVNGIVGKAVGIIRIGMSTALSHWPSWFQLAQIGDANTFWRFTYNRIMSLDDYKVVLYRQDDGGWVAEVPAISGCYALMPTRGEAIEELDRVFALIQEEYQERGQDLPADSTEILHA